MHQSANTDKLPTSYSGDLFMIGAVFAWGVNFPVAKFTLAFMPPLVFSSSRYFAASLILFALLKLQKRSVAISLREAWMLAGIGLLGVTLFQGGWAWGLSLTTASKASILVSITPVFGALISGIGGHWPSLKAWGGIFLSLCGTFIVINNSLTALTVGEGRVEGDLLIIFAAAVWALYTAVNRPLLSLKGPVFVTAWSMLFGAGFLALMDLPGLTGHAWENMTYTDWSAWGFTAIMGAALAFVWYCAGITPPWNDPRNGLQLPYSRYRHIDGISFSGGNNVTGANPGRPDRPLRCLAYQNQLTSSPTTNLQQRSRGTYI